MTTFVMQIVPRLSVLVFAVGLSAFLAPEADVAITFEFAESFSGTPPPSPAPWLSATLSQAAPNVVELTISLPGTVPAGTTWTPFT